jgi:alpha-tubulin suppressor-like RCC1 family protein
MRNPLHPSFLNLALIVTLLALTSPLPARADGRVYVSGDLCGSWGCFGQQDVPASATNVIAVAAGYSHMLALRGDGKVVAWGTSCGSPGSPATQPPVGLSNVVAVAAAYETSMALKSDGRIVIWGGSCTGGWQTNLQPNLADVSGIAVCNNACVAVRSNGTVAAWGLGYWPESELTNLPPTLTNVVSVSLAHYSGLALRADGTVVAWPDYRHLPATPHNFGQTDVPAGLNDVAAIAAGVRFSLALRSNGTVVAWGSWPAGNLPDGLSNVVAIAASPYDLQGFNFGLAALADGSTMGWGLSNGGNVSWGDGLSNVVSVAAGTAMGALYSAEPIIRKHPASRSVIAGDAVTLSVSATSPGPMTYQWRFKGSNIVGATNATLVISGVQAADTGAYDVVVSNANGSVTSAVAVLSLKAVDVQMLAAVTVQGEVGANARVDWSLDAQAWQTLTNFALPYSPFRFVDWDSLGRPYRFYRVIFEP